MEATKNCASRVRFRHGTAGVVVAAALAVFTACTVVSGCKTRTPENAGVLTTPGEHYVRECIAEAHVLGSIEGYRRRARGETVEAIEADTGPLGVYLKGCEPVDAQAVVKHWTNGVRLRHPDSYCALFDPGPAWRGWRAAGPGSFTPPCWAVIELNTDPPDFMKTHGGATGDHKPWSPIKRWRLIADLKARDEIAAIHVSSLLKAQGIQSYIDSNEVWVPLSRGEQACQLLADDAARRPYPLWLRDADGNQRGFAPAVAWEETTDVNRTYEDLLKDAGYGAETGLGRVLRHRRVRDEAALYPDVERIRRRPRTYLGPAGQPCTGYDVELKMGGYLVREEDAETISTTHSGTLVHAQLWNDSRDVAFIESLRWYKKRAVARELPAVERTKDDGQ